MSDDRQERIPEAEAPEVEIPEGIGEPPKPREDRKDDKKDNTVLKAWVGALAVVGLVVGANFLINGGGRDILSPEGEETQQGEGTEQGEGAEEKSSSAKTSHARPASTEKSQSFTSKPDTLEDELLAVGMRYRPSGTDEHKEQWNIIPKDELSDDPGEDWQFAASVMEAAQAISEPEAMGDSTIDGAIELAEGSATDDRRKEFVELLRGMQDGTYRNGYEYDYGYDIDEERDSAPGWSGTSTQSQSNSSGSSGRGYSPDQMLDQAATSEAGGIEDDSGGFNLFDLFGGSEQNTTSNANSSAQPKSSTDGYADEGAAYDVVTISPQVAESETYAPIKEPGFIATSTNPVSTVSADVDTASYANFRRQVKEGCTADQIYDDSVRVEEWVNYFDYGYAAPDEDELFGVTTHLGQCPWNEDTQLLTMGFSTDREAAAPEGGRNIVFLIDVSGSMDYYDKLPLLKHAMIDLLDKLGDEDRISLVTYASNGQTVLNGVKGSERESVRKAIEELYADGATNGGEGLKMAYEAAKKNFIEDGVNRIILCSDGDMNLGMSTTGELQDFVAKKKDEGVYLSVLGFGTGNYHDQNMEAIADNGNGSYHYIDCLDEANKVLDEEFSSTMNPVADDVKIQVEFNPANVKAYRLVGYVNRTLQTGDFRDDTKDGGEVGAGQAFTVAYEIVPVGSEQEVNEVELRYGGGGDSAAAKEVTNELDETTCWIGGKEYEEFHPATTSYTVEFGEDESYPSAPEMKDLPEGWEVLSAKSSTSNGEVTNTVTVGKDKATRIYVFKYVKGGGASA